MNKMFIRDAALLPVVQFQKDGYLRNQHNVLYQISVVPKIFKRVAAPIRIPLVHEYRCNPITCMYYSCRYGLLSVVGVG